MFGFGSKKNKSNVHIPYANIQNRHPRSGGPIPSYHPNYNPRPITDPRTLRKLRIHNAIPKKQGGAWYGLEFRPRQLKFANQSFDETIFILVRRHWSTNLGWIIKNFLYAQIPVGIIAIFIYLKVDMEYLGYKNIFILASFFYTILLSNIVRNFFDWYYDPYIVTDQRIINYAFNPFSSYDIKETYLSSIEFVQEKSSGPLATIFNYGDIIITTSSEQSKFVFEKVPNSVLIRDIVSDLQRIAKTYKD